MKAVRHKIGPCMSQAVRAGDIVYLAGQIPDDRTADITGQTAETLGKIDALLAEMGGSKSDLVSVQIWLSDMTDFAGMNAAWEAWVDPDNPPARADQELLDWVDDTASIFVTRSQSYLHDQAPSRQAMCADAPESQPRIALSAANRRSQVRKPYGPRPHLRGTAR